MLDPETNTYSFLGKRRQAGKLNNYSLYIQDSFRFKPTITLNGGLRWDVQTPFSASNDTMSAVTLARSAASPVSATAACTTRASSSRPDASGGEVPEFVKFEHGTNGYNIDWNNISPNIGVAWRPNVQSGWLRKILGDPEQATLRGGYSVAFERQGFGRFTGVYGGNPGATLTLTRNANTGLVPPASRGRFCCLRPSRLGPAAFPNTPTYPMAVQPNRASNINGFRPDIQVASARSLDVRLPARVSRDMAVEVRYVGTRGVNQWSTLNYNERNLIENGFFDEFMLAEANLQANNAAGGRNRAGSFAYRDRAREPHPSRFTSLTSAPEPTPRTRPPTPGTRWTSTALTRTWAGSIAAGRFGRRPRRRSHASNNAAAAGLPSQFLCRESGRE